MVKVEEKQEYYRNLWERHTAPKHVHQQLFWEQRAHVWEKELSMPTPARTLLKQRVASVTDYLLKRGVLNEEQRVLDLGCGPGWFAIEFSKYAKQVTASDFSRAMLGYGKTRAESQGINNMDFTWCDFRQANLEQLGWNEAFDLVFCSMTPAIREPGGIERMEAVSARYCFTSSVLEDENPWLEQVLQQVFNVERYKKWHIDTYQALFNLLLLRGYLPETYFDEQIIEETYTVTMTGAAKLLEQLPEVSHTEDNQRLLYAYLKTQGKENTVIYHSKRIVYGWLLWDKQLRR